MLEELKKMGADITPIDNNRFIVVDNGFFGFLEDEEPFIIDEDELVEIYNQYK
jgi:cystathionine beta-lyase family protein involved in aluminum resistance